MNLFELFAKISLDSSGFEAALGAAKTALTAATTAVTAFATASVKVGQEFDKSMSQVAATMGLTTEQMQSQVGSVDTSFGHFEGTLRDFAQYMGSNTAFSATEAADALNYMALAGYDAQKSMQMLPNVLNLAAAGGMDLATASDMITDAESALGLETSDVVAMVDQMAKTASKSNTSVSQLGDAILTIGGTANIMAGGTDRLNTVLGLLADNGIKGSEAGTHLRNMILKLASPTEDGADAMEALGLKVFDAQGRMRDFEAIIGDLNTAFEGMSDEKKINYISALFNARDISAVNALLNTSKKRWNELGSAIVDSKDAAGAMAETQLDNLAGDVTLFKSALEGAQIVISDELTPGIRQFVQFGTQGISNIANAFKEGGLSGAMEAFGETLSEGLGMLLENAPMLIEAGAQLLNALIQGIVENLPLLVESGISVLQMLGQSLIENLPVILEALTLAIQEIALMLSNPDTIFALVSATLAILKTIASSIVENLPILIDTVMQVIDNVITFITENLPVFIDMAMQIIMALANGMIDALPRLLDKIPVIIDNITNSILNLLPKIVETGVMLLTSLVTALPQIINTIVKAVPQIVKSITNAITQLVPALIDAGIQLFTAMVDNLPFIIDTIVDAIPQIIDSLVDAFTESGPVIVEAGVKLFTSLIENMPKILRALASGLATIMKSLYEGIGKAIPTMLQMGGQLISGLWQGISNVGEWLREKISGFFGGVVSSIKNFFGIHSPSRVFAGIGEMLDKGLAKGIEDYADVAVKATEEMADDVFGATDGDLDFTAGVNGSSRTAAGRGGLVINVYGSEGQDVEELAEIVSQKIAFGYTQEQAVFA